MKKRETYKKIVTDKYSDFRRHFNRTRERNKKKDKDITSKILTLKDIKDQWERQDGKCAYTGIPMCHISKPRKPNQASLDRIDSSKGYEVGNIQFICLSLNLAKIDFSDKVFKKFLEDIKNS